MSQYTKVRINNEGEALVAAAIIASQGITDEKSALEYIRTRILNRVWDVLLVDLETNKKLNACNHPNKYHKGEPVGIGEFAVLASNGKRLKIGEHIVEFQEEGVQVGCTFVPTKTVDEIYKRLHENR